MSIILLFKCVSPRRVKDAPSTFRRRPLQSDDFPRRNYQSDIILQSRIFSISGKLKELNHKVV